MAIEDGESVNSSVHGENSLSMRTNQSTPIKRMNNTTNRTSVMSDNDLRHISSTGVLEEKPDRDVAHIRSYKNNGSMHSLDDDSSRDASANDGGAHSDTLYELPPLRTPLKKRYSIEPDRKSGQDWNNRARAVSSRSSRDFDSIEEFNQPSQADKMNGISANQKSTIDQLNKQIVSYRLKIKSLYEIIRQLNTDSSKDGNKRNSYMENLLLKIPKEEEFHELKRANINLEHSLHKKNELIDELNSTLRARDDELQKTKHDHTETLEMTREYLEHSEELAKHIDYILDFLLDELPFTGDERLALENARKIGAAFAMVKLNALSSVVKKLVVTQKSRESTTDPENKNTESITKNGLNTPEYTNDNDFAIANSTAIHATANNDSPGNEKGEFDLSDQFLNSQMEEAIEELHKEYDSFVKGIRVKLEKSERLEELLLKKLSEQEKLINDISLLDKEDLAKVLETSKRSSEISVESNEIDGAKDALNKSYQEHIDNLTSHIEILNKDLLEKNNFIDSLKEELEQQSDEWSKMKSRMIRELDDEKELFQRKEQNWKDLLSSYEEQLNFAHEDRDEMMNTITELKSEVQDVYEKNRENIQLLQEELGYLQKKSHSYSNEIFQLTRDNNIMTKKLENVSDNSKKMKNIIRNYKEHSNELEELNSDFESVKKQLLLHLQNNLNIFMTILEEKSVKQALKKLYSIEKIKGLENTGHISNKLESLYVYIENASQSIIENYLHLVQQESDRKHSPIKNEKEMYLRIEELQRKWTSERERRKIDSDVANTKINRLEMENAHLKEQLRKLALKDSKR
ncbi:gamma-tubulin complex subunit SPC72 [Nakaseomyces bracarensis]|uniref:gamma-tubulin complex subunit SPC72 n=1 Tax=Nakaseomyces bracarensis TaxID=273131 RepID=UPI0038714177